MLQPTLEWDEKCERKDGSNVWKSIVRKCINEDVKHTCSDRNMIALFQEKNG